MSIITKYIINEKKNKLHFSVENYLGFQLHIIIILEYNDRLIT